MAAILIQLPADKIQIPDNRHLVNHRVLSKCTTFQEFWAKTACPAESVVEHISIRVAVVYLGTLCELATAGELFEFPFKGAILLKSAFLASKESGPRGPGFGLPLEGVNILTYRLYSSDLIEILWDILDKQEEIYQQAFPRN